jgi:quercetin dioxygenase-like cupin family protein
LAFKDQVITNPVTGETIRFIETAAKSGGNLLKFHLTLAPGSAVPMKHIHTEQDEVFEVLTGCVNVETGSRQVMLVPGEKAVMPKGIAHRWWNNSETESTLYVSFTPAANTEDFFVEMFALASAGRTKPNGAPKFHQAVRMCGKYNIYHPWIPVFVQRSISNLFNLFGKS